MKHLKNQNVKIRQCFSTVVIVVAIDAMCIKDTKKLWAAIDAIL